RATHVQRRSERTRVVPLCEDGAATRMHSIDGLRDANAEALHAARQTAAVVRLNDEVNVVTLDRVVRETEAEAIPRLVERGAQVPKETTTTQTWYVFPHAQGDVHGMAVRMGWSAR